MVTQKLILDFKQIFHVTWVTHSSRISERMKRYGADKNLIPINLNELQEIEVTKYIKETVLEDNLKIISYNICKDHVHLIIVIEKKYLDNVVQKLKSVSSKKFNVNHGLTISQHHEQGSMLPCSEDKIKKARGKSQNHLWAQKFNHTEITNEKQLSDCFNYIKHNRLKHKLPENKELEFEIQQMLTHYSYLSKILESN